MAADAPDSIRLELIPSSPRLALAALAEPIRSWWRQSHRRPTPIQRLAWPAMATGSHCLLAAPTGTGKTLAAFLPIISRMIDESSSSGVRCLYLTPLKALGNDVRRTLRRLFAQLERFVPQLSLSVAVRTGDTSARVRRAMLRRPPDILLTTPESLAVLLSQSAGCRMLADLRWVVVDEVHALAGSKRGADLSLSLERLERRARQPFQRIGLSATCTPLEEAARFLAGSGRRCTVCPAMETTFPQITIEPLGHLPSGEDAHPQRFFRVLLDRLTAEITAARTTLIFTNTRRLAERLTWALRRRDEDWAAAVAVHHSSLAARRRREVERQLKRGELRVVVSSTSLELGIDVGTVENVILVHPPGDVIRLLQRIGRSGHGPGGLRRGLVLTGRASELLEAAVTGAAGRSGQLEPLRVTARPLDVLCQHLLGLGATESFAPDEVFDLVRRAYPYRDLGRADFDDCLAYLAGRDGTGIMSLLARLRERDGRLAIADARTLRLVRRNLGTILAEEPMAVRLADATRIGEVDAAFADRLVPGERILLDGRCLEFRRLERRAAIVEEVPGQPRVPRWQGGGWPLSAELAERLFVFRVRALEALRRGREQLRDMLECEYQLTAAAAELLATYFERQETLSEIPDRGTLLVEYVHSAAGLDCYVHTPLNRIANEALSRVVQYRLTRQGQRSAVPVVADLGFLLSLEAVEPDGDQWRALLRPEDFVRDLHHSLADGTLSRERFRQVACTGLMLLRHPLGTRPRVGGPDWAERRLYDQLQARDSDFVLLRQARREVATEMLDAPAAHRFTQDLPRYDVRVRSLSCISPFAESWTQPVYTPEELISDPVDVLEKLHATLMGARHAG